MTQELVEQQTPALQISIAQQPVAAPPDCRVSMTMKNGQNDNAACFGPEVNAEWKATCGYTADGVVYYGVNSWLLKPSA